MVRASSILPLILLSFTSLHCHFLLSHPLFSFLLSSLFSLTPAHSLRHMFAEHGFDAVVNDDITGMVLNTACMVGGLVAAFSGCLFTYFYYGANSFESYWFSILIAALGFFIGYTITLVLMEVIDAGVATVFVCFVEEPARLKDSSPHFYQKVLMSNPPLVKECQLTNHSSSGSSP
jgi:hypothetical protein